MPDEASLGSWSEVGDAGGSSSAKKGEERDLEMEDELAEDLRNGDAFSDYDMEVTKEGEAINEYLTLLASADQSEKASSSRWEGERHNHAKLFVMLSFSFSFSFSPVNRIFMLHKWSW